MKILVRGVNWIGDAVLTLPAIRSLRKAYPDAHIALLVKPWVHDIFKENPDINEIIIYGEEYKGPVGKIRLANLLKQKKFEHAILLQNAFDAALIAWLAGIPKRTGYNRDGRGFLLTAPVSVTEDVLSLHQVHYYLNIMRAAGADPSETQPYLNITDDERRSARDRIVSFFGHSPKLLIGINPGATYGSAKRWPKERFAEVIVRIITILKGNVMIFGSSAEAGIAEEIMALVKTRHPKKDTARSIVNMAGRTDLRELSALISECDAFITNDSGPMHIAAALLVPIVAVFGSTNKVTTGPFGEGHRIISQELPCSPCMKRECPEGHLRCMTEITAESVFTALEEVIPREKAVFLDRDGTVIEDKHYLSSFDNLAVFPDVKEHLQRLKDAGFKLIGVTNQSGIARGIIDEQFVIDLNALLQKDLGIDDFFYCPHHPDEHCSCRKPEPLMVLKARLRHHIDLKGSYVIGDKELDVQLAQKTGARGILLTHVPPENTCAAYAARDLGDAVDWILKAESKEHSA